jgi:hypothetical protein
MSNGFKRSWLILKIQGPFRDSDCSRRLPDEAQIIGRQRVKVLNSRGNETKRTPPIDSGMKAGNGLGVRFATIGPSLRLGTFKRRGVWPGSALCLPLLLGLF